MKYRRKVQEVPEGDSMTEQSHIPSCDIHTIMKRYEKTGYIDHFTSQKAFYEDVSEYPDFKTALDTVTEISTVFQTMPADARLKFNNDPALYMDYLLSLQHPEQFTQITSADQIDVPATPVATPPPEMPPIGN